MPETEAQLPEAEGARKLRGFIKVGAVVCVAGAAIAALGIHQRNGATAALRETAAEAAIPSVSIVTPEASTATDGLVLPGTLEALNSATIYARTSGYLREWFVDIGGRVSRGQDLAVLDAPEVEHQLAQAKATHSVAVAERRRALDREDRAKRLARANSGAISVDEVEARSREAEARSAYVDAAQADVRRLETMHEFTRLAAPFDGVVTSRSAQVGDLVSSGTGSATPLFTVADPSRIRIYVRAPQNYAARITTGQTARLALPDRPGETFEASVVRTAGAIDARSGSILVELQVDNPDGKLLPGAYAQVTFELPALAGRVRVPGSAILYTGDEPALVVVGDGDRVTLKTVNLGRDGGRMVEILSGVSPQDRIVDTPPDAIRDGDVVRPATDV